MCALNIFGKNSRTNKHLKLFRAVTQSEAQDFATKPLIDLILTIAEEWRLNLNSFYVTGPYPDDGWKSKKGFVNGLLKKDFKNIHNLLISDSSNFFQLNFENWSHNRTIEVLSDTISVELMIDSVIASDDDIIKLVEQIYSTFQFQYGFEFDQTKDFSIREGRINRGLFSYSEKNNQDYEKWSKYASAISSGYLRSVYPRNFLSKVHLNNKIIRGIAEELGSIEQSQGYFIWTLSEQEVEYAKYTLKNSEWLVANHEFDNTETYHFISEEVKKYTAKSHV